MNNENICQQKTIILPQTILEQKPDCVLNDSTNEIKNELKKQISNATIERKKLKRKKISHDNYLQNKEKICKRTNAYYHTHKDLYKRPEYKKQYHKKYWIKNKEKLSEYNRKYRNNRKKADVNFRLRCSLSGRFRTALKGNYKSGSAVRDLGCSIEEFKKYIESKFQDGMTWDNWSKHGWHIDHIKPLASFDLTDRKQVLEAVHYTNLQPLWAVDNIQKSNKII